MEIFSEITTILILAFVISLIMKLLKQPLVIGYILTGILMGPYFLNLIQSGEIIELFSKLGITILLFIVGLNLSPNVIKEVGKVSLVTGLGQVIFTSLIGFLIAIFLGIDRVAALYVSIALTFSSTIIILKLLSDKGDLNKLYGKISIGFLLVQDIVATLILLVTTSFAQSGNQDVVTLAILTLVKGIAVIVIVIAVSSYLLPRITKFIASSQELLFLFALGWGLGMASIFYMLGFSVEIGALVAGVSLSMTPYAFEIGSRLRPLRDFFILLFFILLGSQMILDDIQSLLLPAFILSTFILIGNPIIVIILMNVLGYSRRTGFYAGLTVAQISEFSLILATLGFQIGHLSQEILSLVTFVGLITIAGSTYLILYAEHIYPKIDNLLSLLEFKKPKRESTKDTSYSALLFGYQRVGHDFVKTFKSMKLEYMVVDYNPESVQLLEEETIPHIYGDARDAEFLEELHFQGLKLVVSTMPDFETNLFLVRKIREINRKSILLVVANNSTEAEQLYESGATYVIVPHYLGAQYITRKLAQFGLEKKEYTNLRERHMEYLESRIV